MTPPDHDIDDDQTGTDAAADALRARRANRPPNLTDTQALRYDIEDLATEVHKLRGTLTAFVPKEDMADELDRRVNLLAEDVIAMQDASLEQRGYQTRVWVGAIVVIVLAIVMVSGSAMRFNRAELQTIYDRIDRIDSEGGQ